MYGLQADDICKSYRVKNKEIAVNKHIHLSVAPGNLVWIYGNSGAGKSTFLTLAPELMMRIQELLTGTAIFLPT